MDNYSVLAELWVALLAGQIFMPAIMVSDVHKLRVEARKARLKAELDAVLAGRAKIQLEIGCGHGHWLTDFAANRAESFFVGVDLIGDRIERAKRKAQRAGLGNIAFIKSEASVLVELIPEPVCFEAVHVLFPDPWPKKRHAKRRIIQPEFVTKISEKLKSNGSLHLATDWSPYAEHMIEVLDKIPSLSNAIAPKVFWENPARPETKFEKRGKKLGNRILDLLYQKE